MILTWCNTRLYSPALFVSWITFISFTDQLDYRLPESLKISYAVFNEILKQRDLKDSVRYSDLGLGEIFHNWFCV